MAAASALAQLYSGPAWLGVSQYCERERASQAARSQRCAAARPPPSLVQYCFRVASPPPPPPRPPPPPPRNLALLRRRRRRLLHNISYCPNPLCPRSFMNRDCASCLNLYVICRSIRLHGTRPPAYCKPPPQI